MDFNSKADELIAKHSQVCMGMPSLADIEAMGRGFVKQLIQIAKDTGLLGEDAKETIEEYVRKFYSSVIEPIDLPGPDLIVDKYLLSALIMFADWAYDEMVK